MEKSVRDGLLRYGEHLVNRAAIDKREITITCDLPFLEAVDVKPKFFISEKDGLTLVRKGGDTKGTALHFYAPDYRVDSLFNKIWSGMCVRYCPPNFWDEVIKKKGREATASYMDRHMDRFNDYMNELKHFDMICSPDYSVYTNWGNPNNLLDVWKNRVTGQVFQREGFTVIPTITWGAEDTYDYAFNGVEPGGTYTTSCIGCNDRENKVREGSLVLYRNGIREMVKRLHPIRIIVYGSKELPDADYGNCEVMFFENQTSLRGNEILRQKSRIKKNNATYYARNRQIQTHFR